MRTRRAHGIICKEHNIATRRPWIHNVCSTPYIVSSEMEMNAFMLIYVIVLQEHKIFFQSAAGGYSDVKSLSRLGLHQVLHYNTRKKILLQLWVKVLQ